MKPYWLFCIAVLAVAGCDDRSRSNGVTSTQRAQSAAAPTEQADSTDWKAVDEVMGRSGKPQPGGVYRYSMARSDLQVRVDGVAIKPAFALGSWIAFKRTGEEAVAMGDLVLTEREIAPVMRKLQEEGMQQTALHNHLLLESSAVMYLHVHGHGDPAKIAAVVRAALALTKTPPQQPETAKQEAFELDTSAISRALGHSGQVNGGVYQVSVARAETIKSEGDEIPPSMGLATAINFQPTGAGRAAITGDFVIVAAEVNPVLKTLVENGITVTALHNHLLEEEPRLFFAHFWAHDDAAKLASGLRSALNQMNVKPGTP